MHDITIEKADTSILNPNMQCDYFLQNYPAWEAEVIDKLCSLGFNEQHWPHDKKAKRYVFSAKASGQLGMVLETDLVMDRDTPYSGPDMPLVVQKRFDTFFNEAPVFYVVTKGEEWWPYEPAFLAHDATSYMMYWLYAESVLKKALVTETSEEKRGRGRPRKETGINDIQKQARKESYHQWLASCAEYRQFVEQKRAEYLEAKQVMEQKRQVLRQAEAMGAPKWEA